MSEFLNELVAFIKKESINVYRVAEIYGDGAPVLVDLQECNPCQNSYSVSKFFTLTALGMIWDEGLIDLNEKVTEVLSPYCGEETCKKWGDVTVDMVIRHHCGLPEGYLDIDCDDATTFGSDYLAYVLNTPIGDTDKHVYTDAAYYLIGRMVAERAGKSLVAFLWERLFAKLGFKEVAWSCCPMNCAMGATGLYLRTEDMVKLGVVYLNKGLYGDRRLISEKWIDTVRERNYLSRYVGEGYGHGGMKGQMLAVLPELNCAVAWHGYHSENAAIKDWIDAYLKGRA